MGRARHDDDGVDELETVTPATATGVMGSADEDVMLSLLALGG